MEEAEHLAHQIVVMDLGRVVARGTADELKDHLGGDVLEVCVAIPADLESLSRSSRVPGDPPRVDRDLKRIGAPINGGAKVLIEAGRALDDEGIELGGPRHQAAVSGRCLPLPHGPRDHRQTASTGDRLTDDREPMSDGAIARAPASARSMTLGLAIRDINGITKRNLLRIVRTPQLLFMTMIQPTIILLLFRYVLGGAIHVPGLDYVDYVVPGIFLEAVLIGGMTTALASTDLQAGMIDRFRSLPMARSAFLAGRTLPTFAARLALVLIIGLGLLVGFRFHNGVGACLAGVALIVGFGYAFTWVYAPSDWQ